MNIDFNIESKISRYRSKRRVIITLSVIILAILYTFLEKSAIIGSLSAIVLLVIFYLADHLFNLDFKKRHYLFIIIISISTFLLSSLYYVHPQYDKIQHFVQPLMFSSIVFNMVNKLKLERKWKLTFTFFVIVAAAGIHELAEFGLDYFFDWKLQGVFARDLTGIEKYELLLDRNDDTMIDLLLGVLGSGVHVLYLAIFYNKFKRYY